MIAKNVASQGVYLYAHDTGADAPKTGDAANITGTISKDGAAAAALATTNPTEIGDGVYWQPLSQAETNADAIAVAWESSTSNIQIEPLICLTDRGAVAAQATASALATTDGKIDTIDGIVDTMNAKLVGTIAAGTHNPQSGDAYARLGAPAGASTAADIAAVKAQTAAIETDTQDLQTQVGVDGAGLTAVPWNTAWAAPVHAEASDVIADLNDIDSVTVAAAAAAALASYDPPTNAEMEARTLPSASYSTLTAAQVWAHATRTLSSFGTLVSDIWSHATRTLTAISDSAGITTLLSRIVGTLLAGNHSPQSGDSYARLGAPAGASIAADIAAIDAGTAPTADEIADAVLDEALSGHQTAGTAGAALTAAQSAGDPWSTALPGSYTPGQAGHMLDAIKDKTDTIGAQGITVASPVTETGDLVLYAGQSHTDARALSWTITDWAGPSLAGNSAVLRIKRAGKYSAPLNRAADLEFAATVSQDGTTVTATASLTSAQTATIPLGKHRAQIVSDVAGEETVILDLDATVRELLDAPA